MQIKQLIFKILFCVVLFLPNSLFVSPNVYSHPFYVSVTEFRMDVANKKMSLSCRLFTDDFQNALFKLYAKKVDFTKKDVALETLIANYINSHLSVFVGAKQVEFTYVGNENEEEATWCYFEAKLNTTDKKIRIKNSLLYDFIDSQTNFIHCYYNDNRQSYKLVNPENEKLFEF
ncbi:MAG: hypothetical protein JNL69_13255 [Bacteroidia bacterium]|nr:hypothetical protein [Bacteroidia bacterium]